MLVLTRKLNQSIMIGDDVEVTVLSIDGAKVRLGIQAPGEVPVYRTEIYVEIQRERRGGAPAGEPEGQDVGSQVDRALRDLGRRSP